MSPGEILQFKRELFNSEVTFKESRFGLSARWENHKHPDNPNFMQTVLWVAYVNDSVIHIGYRLDYNSNIKPFAQTPLNGDFRESLFNWYINN